MLVRWVRECAVLVKALSDFLNICIKVLNTCPHRNDLMFSTKHKLITRIIYITLRLGYQLVIVPSVIQTIYPCSGELSL